MKRRTAFLAIAASLLTAMLPAVASADILLLSRITTIAPAEANIGQQIVVTVTSPETDPAFAALLKKMQANKNLEVFRGRFPSNLAGRFGASYKVMFSGARNTFIEGGSLTSLGAGRYSVIVPQGAITGRLKLVRGGASSLSTGTFSVVNLGIALENVSQYQIVSIKVNNVERLGAGQSIPAGRIVDIGLPAGSNHHVIYSIGLDQARPILTRDAGVHTARPFNAGLGGFPSAVFVGRLTAREMLRSTPSFTLTGTQMKSTWMAFNVLTGFMEGYDFLSDTNTGAMTFRRWQGDPSTVVATGTVFEPATWANLVREIAVPLRNPNGSTHANIVISLNNGNFLPSFITGDGLTFEPF